MAEQPKHKVDLLLTIFIVLGTALIFGIIGFAYGQIFTNNSNAINEQSSQNVVITPTPTAKAKTSATTSVTSATTATVSTTTTVSATATPVI